MALKYIKIIIVTIMIVLSTVTAFAYEDFENGAEEIGEEIIRNIPREMQKNYYEFSGKSPNFSDILKMKPSEVVNLSLKYAADTLRKPSKVMAETIVAAILIGAVKTLMNSFGEKQAETIFRTTAILCVSGFLLSPVINCIKIGVKAAQDCNVFISSLIPSISAVMISSGMPTTAGAYNMGVLAVCNITSGLLQKIALPFLGIYISLGFAGSVSQRSEITDMGNAIKNFMVWLLGFIMFLFTGFLSLQSIIGTATDNLAVKTAKFAISGFVPIIGSAVSDAFSTAGICLKIIKSSLGVFGVGMVLISLLPSVIKAAVWYITCKISMFIFSVLGIKEIGSILNICSEAMKITLSFLSAYAVMVVISLGIAIFIGAGG